MLSDGQQLPDLTAMTRHHTLTARDDPPTPSRHVLVALRRIIRAVDQHSRALIQRCGLTGPQLIVLKEIAEREPVSLGELARAVHISQATLTGIVDRLEARGLLDRRRSETDRRRVMVASTERSRAVLESAPPLLHESFIDGFGRLPDWEQTQILASLQRLAALMEARELPAAPILTTGPLDGTDGEGADDRTG